MDRYRNCPCSKNRSYPVSNTAREQSREIKYDVPAISFVADQPFGDLYSPEDGWKEGTIFRGLNKPLGCGGCEK